jgi:hypothetical protein
MGGCAEPQVFDEHYLAKYQAAGLLDRCGGELPHLISDAATMQIIRWTDGGFGMAAHNCEQAWRAAPPWLVSPGAWCTVHGYGLEVLARRVNASLCCVRRR